MRLRTASMRSAAVGASHLLPARLRLFATRSSCAASDHRRWALWASALRCALALRASFSAAASRAPGSAWSPRIRWPPPRSACAPPLAAVVDNAPGGLSRPRIAWTSRSPRLSDAPVPSPALLCLPRHAVDGADAAAFPLVRPPGTFVRSPQVSAASVPPGAREVPAPGRRRPSSASSCREPPAADPRPRPAPSRRRIGARVGDPRPTLTPTDILPPSARPLSRVSSG